MKWITGKFNLLCRGKQTNILSDQRHSPFGTNIYQNGFDKSFVLICLLNLFSQDKIKFGEDFLPDRLSDVRLKIIFWNFSFELKCLFNYKAITWPEDTLTIASPIPTKRQPSTWIDFLSRVLQRQLLRNKWWRIITLENIFHDLVPTSHSTSLAFHYEAHSTPGENKCSFMKNLRYQSSAAREAKQEFQPSLIMRHVSREICENCDRVNHSFSIRNIVERNGSSVIIFKWNRIIVDVMTRLMRMIGVAVFKWSFCEGWSYRINWENKR